MKSDYDKEGYINRIRDYFTKISSIKTTKIDLFDFNSFMLEVKLDNNLVSWIKEMAKILATTKFLSYTDSIRACSHKRIMRIFESDFGNNKAKFCRHTGVWQGILTQLVSKSAKKTYDLFYVNTL